MILGTSTQIGTRAQVGAVGKATARVTLTSAASVASARGRGVRNVEARFLRSPCWRPAEYTWLKLPGLKEQLYAAVRLGLAWDSRRLG